MSIDDTPHDELRAQLAALAAGDGAGDLLTVAQRAALEAHLAGCALCERELALQRQVHDRLGAIATREAAPEALAAMVRGLARPPGPPRVRSSRAAIAVAISGWMVAAVVALGWWLAPQRARVRPPMVDAALNDFDRALGRELPGLGAGVGHPVAALAHPDLQLISSWRAEIRGEPASALAYRLRDRIVVQYVVSEALLYRQPDVREAVHAHGVFAVSEGARSVVAFARGGAGSVLVGAVSPAELISLSRDRE